MTIYKKSKQKKIVAALLGTVVEYYDYSLYGFSAGIIATKFFPPRDQLTSLLMAFAVYYVSYLSKPLGALFFGWFGDAYGRRAALSATIIGIAIPTIIIGILPEYSVLGNWCIITLVICRCLQGIFAAGEYDGAAIYIIEHLGEKSQFTASACTRTTGVIGLLLGIGATNLFSSHIFPEWGWRIPFLLSLPFSLITLFYRRHLSETPDFNESKLRQFELFGLRNLFKKHWRSLFLVVFAAGGFGGTYQVAIIFMKQYLPIALPQSQFIISTFSVLLVVAFGIPMPIAGLVADRIGAMKVLFVSVVGTLASCLLLAIAISFSMLNLAMVAALMIAIFVAPFNALAHGVIIRAFPVNYRYRAVSIGHTIGSLLLSGSANSVCLIFMKSFGFTLFPLLYIAIFAIMAYFAVRLFIAHTQFQKGY